MDEETVANVLAGDFHSTKRTTGVGLGFGVARRIVGAHGGEIEVRSELGRGTEMIVRLPVVAAGERAPEADAAGDAEPAAGERSDAAVLQERSA